MGGKMKNPPRQRGGGLKKSDCSSDSLAVFYVEQVALNRHVSSTDSIVRRYTPVKAFFLFCQERNNLRSLLHSLAPNQMVVVSAVEF